MTLLNLSSYLQSVAEELLEEPWMLLVSLYFWQLHGPPVAFVCLSEAILSFFDLRSIQWQWVQWFNHAFYLKTTKKNKNPTFLLFVQLPQQLRVDLFLLYGWSPQYTQLCVTLQYVYRAASLYPFLFHHIVMDQSSIWDVEAVCK